jgi:UDP-GlcNAc3NAcA epimerase
MIRLLNIIGARPQIIKAAAISRTIRDQYADQIYDIIIHTGQHYDTGMSQVFIDELNIPEPAYNLKVGSKSHGKQTAEMISGIEEIIENEKPDYVLAYGDTNSTLAAAIAASKMFVPLVHIEAGMRSYTKHMPEEINRVLCDHASSIMFTPTRTGYNNLVKEGFNPENEMPWSINHPGIIHCGDIMYDNYLYYLPVALRQSRILSKTGIENRKYNLVTIHRPSNTDNSKRLEHIFEAILEISTAEKIAFVIPLHPRTARLMKKGLDEQLLKQLQSQEKIIFTEPVSFLDMILLENNANMILTDSGGVQKEAYFFNIPCIVLRKETEWVELVTNGAAVLADADKSEILRYYQNFSNNRPEKYPPVFGDGHAASQICRLLIENISTLH